MSDEAAMPTPSGLQRYLSGRQGQQAPPPNVSEQALLSPVGLIRWALLGPTLAIIALLYLLFTRSVTLGTYQVNWLVKFDVNWGVCIVVLLAGTLAIAPNIIRNRAELLSSNTLISAAITLLAALFFAAHVANLGTFEYTQRVIDINTVVLYGLCIGLAYLTTRGGQIAGITLGVFIIWWAFTIDDFSFWKSVGDLFDPNGTRLFKLAFPPHWKTGFARAIEPLFLTVQIAIGSLLLGVLGALPLSFLAARNTSPHPVIYNAVRASVGTIRAVPAFFVALLLIPFLGLGAAPGIFGLGLHTITTLTKVFAESIETVRPEPLEALAAVGANGIKTFRWAVFPQVFPLIASYSLYTFESIVRDSTVLAFVGGGGIGFLIYDSVQVLDYSDVAVFLAMLIVAVILLERVSSYLRSKII